MTTLPRVQAVPPARSASASSMQSPPANADATSVIILSPVLARPGARPRSRRRSTSWDKAEVQGQGGGKEQAGIVDQAVVVEGDVDAVEVVAWSHLLGAPCFWSVFCYKTIIPDSEEHFLPYPPCRDTPSIGGFGLRNGLEGLLTRLRKARVGIGRLHPLRDLISRKTESYLSIRALMKPILWKMERPTSPRNPVR